MNPTGWLAMGGTMALLLTASMATTTFASGASSGAPGPCVSIFVPAPNGAFSFNVGGDVTLKANVSNCSSDTLASQLVVTFETIGGGFWCAYPESAGSPANFSMLPGTTRSVACTEAASINGSFAGFRADARVYANCTSFSTHGGVAVRNFGGSLVSASQGFSSSTGATSAGSCAVIATSNTYTVLSAINPNGVPRK
jgi:hypothetical protein